MGTTRRPSPVLPVLLFGAACGAALFALLAALRIPPSWHYGAAVAYLTAITLVLHVWQERALEHDPKGFVNRFMLGLVGKMLLSLLLIVIVLFTLPRGTALPLALAFAVLYLAFLAFSATRLSMRSRNGPAPKAGTPRP